MLGVVGEAERPPPSGATLAAGLRKRAARRAQLNRDDCKVAKGGVSGELSERVDPVDGICPHRDRPKGKDASGPGPARVLVPFSAGCEPLGVAGLSLRELREIAGP
jgi:hypothetical protein